MSHPISDSLAIVADPKERGRVKARAFVALTKQAGRSLTKGKYKALLLDAPSLLDGGIEFHIRITKGNKDVTPPEMVGPDGRPGHIRIWNPPLCVDDPAGDIVQTSTDPVTKAITTRKLREDPAAALIAVVGRIVDGLP